MGRHVLWTATDVEWIQSLYNSKHVTCQLFWTSPLLVLRIFSR